MNWPHYRTLLKFLPKCMQRFPDEVNYMAMEFAGGVLMNRVRFYCIYRGGKGGRRGSQGTHPRRWEQ